VSVFGNAALDKHEGQPAGAVMTIASEQVHILVVSVTAFVNDSC